MAEELEFLSIVISCESFLRTFHVQDVKEELRVHAFTIRVEGRPVDWEVWRWLWLEVWLVDIRPYPRFSHEDLLQVVLIYWCPLQDEFVWLFGSKVLAQVLAATWNYCHGEIERLRWCIVWGLFHFLVVGCLLLDLLVDTNAATMRKELVFSRKTHLHRLPAIDFWWLNKLFGTNLHFSIRL